MFINRPERWTKIEDSSQCYDGDRLIVDLRYNMVTLKLPINPKPGEELWFFDLYNKISINPIRFESNGKKIDSTSAQFYSVNEGRYIRLLFVNETIGWKLEKTNVYSELTKQTDTGIKAGFNKGGYSDDLNNLTVFGNKTIKQKNYSGEIYNDVLSYKNENLYDGYIYDNTSYQLLSLIYDVFGEENLTKTQSLNFKKIDKTYGSIAFFGLTEDNYLYVLGYLDSFVSNQISLGLGDNVNSVFEWTKISDHKFTDFKLSRTNVSALDEDGIVYCWGYNDLGHNGTGINDTNYTNIPTQVLGDHSFSSLLSTCSAMKADGSFWGWGPNVEIGNGNGLDTSSPIQGASGKIFTKIISIKGHNENGYTYIGLDNSNKIWGWGLNDSYGTIGDGYSWLLHTVNHNLMPVYPDPLDGATNYNRSYPIACLNGESISDICIGGVGNGLGTKILALKTNGEVYGWPFRQTTPAASSGYWAKPTKVFSGSYTSVNPYFLEKDDSSLWAWSENYLDSTSYDIYVENLTTDGNPVSLLQFSTNPNYKFHQNGFIIDSNGNISSPGITYSPIIFFENKTNIDDYFKTAILTDGFLRQGADFNIIKKCKYSDTSRSNPISGTTKYFAYGKNTYGQLGNGTFNDSTSGVEIQFENPDNIVDIKTGALHSIALDTSGKVWAWGSNNCGQLGDGTRVDKNSPVQILCDKSFIDIACGAYHSMAITKDGEVYSWGSNLYGQTGTRNISFEDNHNDLLLYWTCEKPYIDSISDYAINVDKGILSANTHSVNKGYGELATEFRLYDNSAFSNNTMTSYIDSDDLGNLNCPTLCLKGIEGQNASELSIGFNFKESIQNNSFRSNLIRMKLKDLTNKENDLEITVKYFQGVLLVSPFMDKGSVPFKSIARGEKHFIQISWNLDNSYIKILCDRELIANGKWYSGSNLNSNHVIDLCSVGEIFNTEPNTEGIYETNFDHLIFSSDYTKDLFLIKDSCPKTEVTPTNDLTFWWDCQTSNVNFAKGETDLIEQNSSVLYDFPPTQHRKAFKISDQNESLKIPFSNLGNKGRIGFNYYIDSEIIDFDLFSFVGFNGEELNFSYDSTSNLIECKLVSLYGTETGNNSSSFTFSLSTEYFIELAWNFETGIYSIIINEIEVLTNENNSIDNKGLISNDLRFEYLEIN